MKAINRLFLGCLVVFLTASCDDIIEKDITNDTVQLVSPIDDAQIESNVVSFQWNNLEDADKYRIQVYADNQIVALDSVVTATHLTIPMSPGTYQWRVRGENSAYVSSYSFPMSFSLIETTDLENQQVILSSPTAGLYTNNTNITCTWESLSAADDYTFELVNVSEGGIVIHQEENIVGTSFLLTSTYLEDDAQYQWKVMAVNSTGNTEFSSRTFYKDTVNPNVSTNSLPADNSIQVAGTQISFGWSVPSDSGVVQAPLRYVIEFANDSAFSSIVLTSTSLSTNSFQNIFSTAGTYYWRVRTTDMAGNQSGYSTAYKFIIN
ncbi:MAG TPA: hypothetical protein VK623_05680 [Flavobacterium sp.]|nr:hypothetical protein [Flavobacterium sp.]